MGSIFRTADGAGVDKIFLCGITPTPDVDIFGKGASSQIAKTALGAEKILEWHYEKQSWRLLKKLKEEGFRIVALEQTPQSKNLFSAEGRSVFGRKNSIVLVVGNEVNGLSSKILEYVDDIIEIPMHGSKESLNVSVATGIALYKLREFLK